MKVRDKALLLVLGATLAGIVLVLHFSASTIQLSGLAGLEEQAAQRDLERVLNLLGDDQERLGAIATRWALAPDRYPFMRSGGDPALKADPDDGVLENLRLNVILFLSPSGEVLYGQGYDLQKRQRTAYPEELRGYCEAGGPLMASRTPVGAVTGLLLLEAFEPRLLRVPPGASPPGDLPTAGGTPAVRLACEPLLVAAHSVAARPPAGQPAGILILGRFLDDEEVARVAKLAGSPLVWRRWDAPDLPEDFRAARPQLAGGRAHWVQALSEDTISGYALLRDLEGAPALLLRVDRPRGIYAEGLRSLLYLGGALLLTGLVFGVVGLVIMDRMILSRLSRLSASVSRIGAGGAVSGRVELAGGDELAGLAADINRMLAALEQSQRKIWEREEALARAERDAIVGRLATTVAHGVNNPLAAIKMQVNLLAEDVGEAPEAQRRLQTVSDQVARIARTVQTLLGFARQRALAGQHVPLEEVIRTAADLFEGGFRAKDIGLEVDVPAGLAPIQGNADEIQEVLVNLLENAREALSAGQLVRVSARSQPGGIELCVEDTGPGLGPDPEKVFEPFYTTKTTGTGLGLAIVRKICAKHGASLAASNRPAAEGGGARFRICFPNRGQGPAADLVPLSADSGPPRRPLSADSGTRHQATP